jgi:hypothetical protein
MLKSLVVDGFRGISTLSLEDFSTINIFVGANGSGKTSVLEACALAADPISFQLLGAFSQWRELPPPTRNADDGFRSFFPMLDIHRIPRLSYMTSAGANTVEISGLLSNSTSVVRAQSTSASVSPGEYEALSGVKVTYTPAKSSQIVLTCTLNDQGYNAHFNIPPQRELGAFYIHGRRSMSAGETATLVTRLYEQKREGPFINTLRRINKRIERLQPGLRGNVPLVLADIGGDRMIPINLLGDGFCRICLMLTGILWDGARVTVVDEIDSGLHHSVMTKFWQDAADMLGQMKHQLFCVTHSDEMLLKSLDAFAANPDALRVFHIERNDDGSLVAHRYTYNEYKRAALEGEEIR